MARAYPIFALLFSVSACAPAVGDPCETSLDCSAQSTRLCDLTQRGGYCTLPNCERGTCPEDSVCVLFRPDTLRLSSSFCMAECDADDDCRTEHGYACRSQGPEARVLDGTGRRFCGQRFSLLMTDPADDDSDDDDDAGVE